VIFPTEGCWQVTERRGGAGASRRLPCIFNLPRTPFPRYQAIFMPTRVVKLPGRKIPAAGVMSEIGMLQQLGLSFAFPVKLELFRPYSGAFNGDRVPPLT
jgi:hypothetical protein